MRDGDLRARPLLTSEYVVDETATTLLSHAGPGIAATAIEQLRASAQIRIRHVDGATFDAACDRFVEYDDQAISFTDHVVAVQARANDADYVLSFDGDFETLGLTTLPEA